MRTRFGGLRPRALALLALTSGLCSAISVRAESSTPEASVPDLPRGVHVAIVGAAPASLDDRISSWFRADSVPTTVTRQESLDRLEVLQPAQRSPVGVWIVVHETAARFFFSVSKSDTKTRYLTSDLELEHGLDEVGMEQLAQVVYFSSLALWRGESETERHELEHALEVDPLVKSVSQAPEAAVPAVLFVAAPPRIPDVVHRERAWRLHTGAEYSARWRGPENLGHGPGALFAFLRSNRATRSGARIHLDLLLPVRPERRDVELDVRGYAVNAGAFLSWPVDAFFLDAELGAGADLIRYSTYSVNNPGLRGESGAVDARPLVYTRVGIETAIGPFRIGLAGLLTVQLLHTVYNVAELVGHSELIEPWLVQPGIAFELLY